MAEEEKMTTRREVETAAIDEKMAHDESLNQMKHEAEHLNIDEKKLLLKTDLHVVPILFLLFLCAFIDRLVIPSLVNSHAKASL